MIRAVGDSSDPDGAQGAESPAFRAALSPLGRRLEMPANFLPQQTAEARGKRFNATIGQITDGHGSAVPLPSVAAALSGLPEAMRSRALLYSPVEGVVELRERWRARQRRGQTAERPSSLPLATGGTLHALSLAAQLFATAGRPVLLAAPPPAGYVETFGLRTGARLAYVHGLHKPGFDPVPLVAAFRTMRDEQPALIALRLPASPEEPPLSAAERAALARTFAMGAARRPIVVVVDDLWERFEPGGASGSLFWDLAGLHPALLPLKVDGAEGEIGYPGARIGFLTLPFPPGSTAARELEDKVKLLLRAEIGSPSAASQMVLLAALAAEG
jgi:aspartate/methionine/tyrosine aminotransferase